MRKIYDFTDHRIQWHNVITAAILLYTIVTAVLKLTHVIDITWGFVFAMIISYIATLGLIVLAYIVSLIIIKMKRHNNK